MENAIPELKIILETNMVSHFIYFRFSSSIRSLFLLSFQCSNLQYELKVQNIQLEIEDYMLVLQGRFELQ